MRSRLETRKSSLRPWTVALACSYEDHTSDIEDNRILSCILFVIIRSGALTGRERPNVRRACRILQEAV